MRRVIGWRGDAAGRSTGGGSRAIGAAVLTALVLAIGACGQTSSFGPSGSADGDFKRASDEYTRGHFLTAVELLESFERQHPGSQFIDDALFLLGKAHQGNREFLLARQAFERVRDDYPQSPLAEQALFEIARSWFQSMRGPALDPEPAEEAVRTFRVYLRRFPEGAFRAEADEGVRGALAVLAEKQYLNGVTYLRLNRLGAARRCFEASLEKWDQSPNSAQALAGIARAYEREGSRAEARDAYQRLRDHLGDDPARYRDGDQLGREAQRKLAELAEPGS
jgi:outer membrane assembly lipoprotein YfiO